MNRMAAYWNRDALRTRLFDGLSLLLPAGEAFVIQAVQDWLDASPEAESRLRAEAARFVREEKSHQRAHRQYNAVLAQTAPVANGLEQRIARAVSELDALGLTMRLALAEAFEHLTALISAEVLRGDTWVVDSPSRESRMWRWHCAEELAHKHVATDLLRTRRRPPGLRALALLLASVYLASDTVCLTWALCRHDLRAGALRPAALLAQAGRFAWRAAPSLLRIGLGWFNHLVPLRQFRAAGRENAAIH
jgi:uncharacterized protein